MPQHCSVQIALGLRQLRSSSYRDSFSDLRQTDALTVQDVRRLWLVNLLPGKQWLKTQAYFLRRRTGQGHRSASGGFGMIRKPLTVRRPCEATETLTHIERLHQADCLLNELHSMVDADTGPVARRQAVLPCEWSSSTGRVYLIGSFDTPEIVAGGEV